jgi:hypothetical protein
VFHYPQLLPHETLSLTIRNPAMQAVGIIPSQFAP